MTILCILLVAVILALIAVMVWRERVHRAVTADLLDRVMARSYGEYVATKPQDVKRQPRRRGPLSDEEMHELEQRALAAREAQS